MIQNTFLKIVPFAVAALLSAPVAIAGEAPLKTTARGKVYVGTGGEMIRVAILQPPGEKLFLADFLGTKSSDEGTVFRGRIVSRGAGDDYVIKTSDPVNARPAATGFPLLTVGDNVVKAHIPDDRDLDVFLDLKKTDGWNPQELADRFATQTTKTKK